MTDMKLDVLRMRSKAKSQATAGTASVRHEVDGLAAFRSPEPGEDFHSLSRSEGFLKPIVAFSRSLGTCSASCPELLLVVLYE